MKRCHRPRILLTTLLWSTLLSLRPADSRAEEQYVAVNIIPGEAYPPIFEEIARLTRGRTSAHVVVGIGAIFSYLDKCRYVCIYNWSGIRSNGPAVDAILSITDDRKH